MKSKEVITDIPISKLTEAVQSMGLKAYTATQLIGWLYGRCVESFNDMTNLSKEGRKILSERFEIGALTLQNEIVADDGTRKYAFGLRDGGCIESVFIPAPDGRRTLCISTQVGCAIGCAFCRTGNMGLERNLTLGEIIGQVIEVTRSVEGGLTNIVFMGMGEPMMNLDTVCFALEILQDERAFCLSKRRITVSTSGLIPELKKLTERFDVKIAISLNATTDQVRQSIMPINSRYSIADIMDFCRMYSKKAKHRITFEYVMIGGVNDTEDDSKRLVRLLSGIKAKVNLIPFNPFPGTELKAPSRANMEWWLEFLVKRGIQANIRVSRGQEILAACGQLASKLHKKKV